MFKTQMFSSILSSLKIWWRSPRIFRLDKTCAVLVFWTASKTIRIGCFCFLIQLLIRMTILYKILCSLVFNKFYQVLKSHRQQSWYWFPLCFPHELLMSFWRFEYTWVLHLKSSLLEKDFSSVPHKPFI